MEEIEKTKEEEKKEKENKPMTTENLERLLKEITPEETVFSEVDLDLPVETAETEGQQPEEQLVSPIQEDTIVETEGQTLKVKVTNLESWFTQHVANIDNINKVVVQLRGVDSKKTLIVSVKIPGGGVDEQGNDRRFLKVFDNADIIPVLDLPPVVMDIYNNGFRIVHQHATPTNFIKTYVAKMNIVCTLCTNVNGKLIPYEIIKINKKETEIEMNEQSNSVNIQKLQDTADLESLQLLYKQSLKSLDKFTTNLSVIEWLLERQEGILDINHHLQIDNVIITLLK